MSQSLNPVRLSSGPNMNDLPAKQGLYDPAFEHDACGVAFVVDMHGGKSHAMVQRGLDSLCNLDHRRAPGAEDNVGDGHGILTPVPDAFFRDCSGFALPAAGSSPDSHEERRAGE